AQIADDGGDFIIAQRLVEGRHGAGKSARPAAAMDGGAPVRVGLARGEAAIGEVRHLDAEMFEAEIGQLAVAAPVRAMTGSAVLSEECMSVQRLLLRSSHHRQNEKSETAQSQYDRQQLPHAQLFIRRRNKN